jgi:integrase
MRTSRDFSSSLAPSIRSYLSVKQALGRRFRIETDILAHLDRFLVAQAAAADLTPEIFESWCLTLAHLTPTVRRNWMRIVRNLCLHRQRTVPHCFVPDPSGFPTPHVSRRPYIFSEEDILRLLRSAADLRPRTNAPLHGEGLRLSVVLLYTAGLRRGELARLVLSDYDHSEGTLLIRASKFHKSRLVALSQDAIHEIEVYLQARRRLPHDAESPLLIARSGGLRGRSGPGLGHSLRHLFRRAGVRMTSGSVPRVHDLRHAHAVHVLLGWYRAGVDVQAKLPALAASMGHVSIASTAYYLSFLEPVAQAASERFARHCSHLLPPTSAAGGDQ